MSALTALFYVFAAMTVFAALRVITSRNPVHSALYLVLTFVSAAAIWMILKAEFLAIVLVLVYVGAVMVLFLFVVMMLDVNMDSGGRGFWRSSVAVFVGLAVALELAAVLFLHFKGASIVDAPPLPADYDNTKALGALLYTEYVYPFELAAVLLLVAIVAAIALTLRRRKDVRYNDPSRAVRTRAADRLRVVSMAPVPRAEAAPDTPAADAADGGPAK
ncbi:MAG: NADH-quinone oxidoreductase subunit J [Burkholderiaceae bacterium]|jgi:NADH-quinone oxidoreductase subunit J|nr:NADH-quinone oxidoreductase subunit J [Burkholderiaceae bacterium]MEB2319994.1 NADH-quinone oxidoreductase subunit J [Pseudomonadota bacterium]